jgi:membrane protein implicated in regulation of membrane protease activity
VIIYVALGGGGLALLLILLLVGGLGDHDVPVHEAALDHGDLDGHGGPSPLGVRVLASFATFFGVGGIIGQYLSWGHPGSSLLGIVLGLIAGTLVYRFARLLHEQQADSHLAMSDLVRRHAQVVVAIPGDGVGEVSLRAGAEQTVQLARSADGQAIASGRDVIVTSIRGNQLLVKRSSHGDER